MVFKCKMCGGDIQIIDGSSICECEYCGSRQTLPNFDDDKKTKLFERANRLRFECEFDKAASIYESIVAEFPEEAEAYWGLVLCKYGIEYVDDPKTGDKIPTCHRLSFDGVTVDANFDNALLYGNKESREIYSSEASRIEEIRKKVVAVSSREQPYDVFICYKESDANGGRTEDSVLAQKIYEELTIKDYRVFFSKISLESKIGEEYEPYIFAALNSAKIMLVVGTDYNNINSIWVRNEWSRYLDLMKRNKDKMLIPCYKDMDPYDLPKEFSGLQAQDMGKVGAIQDLIRGMGKVVPKGTPQSVGVTEDTLKAALKQEAKKRTIRTAIIGVCIAIVASFALFAGVKALVDMIKNNKNTTVINNETVVTEATTEATTEEIKKDWKITEIVCNTSEDDVKTDKKEIYSTTAVYFHWDIEEGPKDENLKLLVKVSEKGVVDNAGDSEYIFDSEYIVGDNVWFCWSCTDDNTGEPMNFMPGSISIKVYNAKTDEFLGGKTINIK